MNEKKKITNENKFTAMNFIKEEINRVYETQCKIQIWQTKLNSHWIINKLIEKLINKIDYLIRTPCQ